MGFVVRLAVPPQVGDRLTVDQNSIKKLKQEELHQTDWQIVEWHHELSLDCDDPDKKGQAPEGSLWVVVHPMLAARMRVAVAEPKRQLES
jgi:hypothetical protein